MNDPRRQIATWAVGPLLLVLLFGWSARRAVLNADEARRTWSELYAVQGLAEQIADLGGGQAASGEADGGLFGRIQSIADGAGIAGTQLANLERVEPAFGETPGARLDLRGVGLAQVITFLDAWADSGTGRGARTINLIPEGDDHDDLWTARLRLDG